MNLDFEKARWEMAAAAKIAIRQLNYADDTRLCYTAEFAWKRGGGSKTWQEIFI